MASHLEPSALVNSRWKWTAILLACLFMALVSKLGWDAALSPDLRRYEKSAGQITGASVPISESQSRQGIGFHSDWMPLPNYPAAENQRVECSVAVKFVGKTPVFILFLKSEAHSGTCWESESSQKAILVTDDGRVELDCSRKEDRLPDRVMTVVGCSGLFPSAVTAAKSMNPKLLFGTNLIELGPQVAGTCRELVRKAMKADHRNKGLDKAESDRLIARALSEGL